MHSRAMPPLMSAEEQEFVRQHLSETSRVLEWGSGGSTVHFSSACRSWLSIEHHYEWAAKVKAAVPADGNGKVSLVYLPPDLPVVPIIDDSLSYGEGYEKAFNSYVQAALLPAVRAAGGDDGFDVILIDGRARLFCALLCVEGAEAEGGVGWGGGVFGESPNTARGSRALPPNEHLRKATILFHDFRPRRRYWPILEYCDVVGSVESGRTMVALCAKS